MPGFIMWSKGRFTCSVKYAAGNIRLDLSPSPASRSNHHILIDPHPEPKPVLMAARAVRPPRHRAASHMRHDESHSRNDGDSVKPPVMSGSARIGDLDFGTGTRDILLHGRP